MSLIRATGIFIGKIVALIVGFFITAGPYYTMLDELFNVATDTGGTELNAFLSWAYGAFYYGYPSVIVFGIVFIMYGFLMELRRRYYATEEAGYYSY
jgi:hypothetical protein